MRRLLIILLTVAAILPQMAYAVRTSGGDLMFVHHTTRNGLPANCVRDLSQDSTGYIWAATDGGLCRYDGHRWRTFRSVDNAAAGNAGRYVLSLAVCRSRLLVGTDNGLQIYDPERESLRTVHLNDSAGKSCSIEGDVRNVLVDRHGCVWMSVDGHGIYRIDSRWTVKKIYDMPEINNYVSTLYEDSLGDLWAVSSQGDGLVYRYDAASDRFRQFGLTLDGVPFRASPLCIYEDVRGDYWLGTWTEGLLRFNPRTGVAERVVTPDSCAGAIHIHSIAPYGDGYLLIGSDSGLCKVDIATGSHELYVSDELDSSSLSDQFIYPILNDREGGVWIGTFYGGINYLSPIAGQFSVWSPSRFVNSVSGRIVSALAEDSRGNIWIGSDDGGLSRYEPATGHFTHFSMLGGGDGKGNIHALYADGDRLWIGSYAHGMAVMDIAGGNWKKVPFEGKGDEFSAYAIYRDTRGTLWAGVTGMLSRYDESKGMIVPVRELGAWIVSIDEDASGHLWIATHGRGVYCFDPERDVWTNYRPGGHTGSLSHTHVNHVKVGRDGRVYMATANGLDIFDMSSSTFVNVPRFGDSCMVQSVFEEGDAYWVATTDGLYRCREGYEPEAFGADYGMTVRQFQGASVVEAGDGRVYLGSVEGLCAFDPRRLRRSPACPPVIFTGLYISSRYVEVGDPRLPRSLTSAGRLVLRPEDNSFSICFSALSYANPLRSNLEYRLEGFGDTWTGAGEESRCTYTNLPPGRYTLQVRVAGGNDADGSVVSSLEIEVLHPWYATVWMKLLYVVLGAAVLAGIMVAILWRRERVHYMEIDRISANQEREVYKAKLNFFTMVAHEIRTPVSLIIGPLEKVMASAAKSAPELGGDLSTIDRNSRRLLDLVNQLLDFKKVDNAGQFGNFAPENVSALLLGVAERFRSSVETAGATLEVSLPDGDIIASVDREAVTKLISNLLNNARKYTKDYIMVECRRDTGRGEFVISVGDNGIGIPRHKISKIFTPFYQIVDSPNQTKGGTGLGLSIVKSVVNAHGGKIDVKSTRGEGSTFIVRLPLVQREESVSSRQPESESVASHSVSAGLSDGRHTMLVVDDNEEMLKFISGHFSGSWRVLASHDGEEALKTLEDTTVDIIICDWMMPVMDGMELLRRVRADERLSHLPFVMLTAKTDNMSKIEGMNSGADAYVEKPFSIGFLEARVDNLLELRKMLRNKYSELPLTPLATLSATPSDTGFLQKLENLIEDNLTNPELSVDFIVEQMGIGRSSLYTKIKQLADVTPRELIQITRLKKAASLLAQGDCLVADVCYTVGFSSPSYFTKCFQKQFGVRPADFMAHSEERRPI